MMSPAMGLKEIYQAWVQSRAARREVAISDALARQREFNPDGSSKNAAQISSESRDVVERMRTAAAEDLLKGHIR